MKGITQRFTNRWLMNAALRHMPFIVGILAVQALYPVDPEASLSPVAIYVLINLLAVVAFCAFVARDRSRSGDVRFCAVLAVGGFGLLLLNELVTWNSETYTEDVYVLTVWIITAAPTVYAVRRLLYPRAIAVTLTIALGVQLLAFVADLLDDGALGENSTQDWLSWAYACASIASIGAYQLAFLYMALQPGRASHGWVVTARLADGSKLHFDVGTPDADAAIAAVEKHVGPNARNFRAVAPIPASSFFTLALEPGQVKEH